MRKGATIMALTTGKGADWTVAQAANFLGCDPRTVYRKIESGDLPAYRFGPKSTRVRPADVEALVMTVAPRTQVAAR